MDNLFVILKTENGISRPVAVGKSITDCRHYLNELKNIYLMDGFHTEMHVTNEINFFQLDAWIDENLKRVYTIHQTQVIGLGWEK